MSDCILNGIRLAGGVNPTDRRGAPAGARREAVGVGVGPVPLGAGSAWPGASPGPTVAAWGPLYIEGPKAEYQFRMRALQFLGHSKADMLLKTKELCKN